MYRLTLILLFLPILFACQNESESPEPVNESLYFPPLSSDEWESIDPAALGWDLSKLPTLESTLQNNNTRAFIVLKDGKIVLEYYYGQDLNGNPFGVNSNWYWASAGKTLTAFMVGKAQEEGLLNIQDKSSDYLGEGWTSLPPSQEADISIWHQLTMTSGLDDGVSNSDCTLPECLQYLAAPGTRWSYHNAPYTLLSDVVAAASGQSYSSYFNNKLRDKIGMKGLWIPTGDNNVYYSDARSMARFGLLMLNKGKWEEEVIMQDHTYYEDLITTSQSLNKSYGYLWWLNGKESFMIPQFQQVFNGSLCPDAPADTYAGIGKNGQLLNVIPSQNLVVVRMGESSDNAPVALITQNEIWEVLKTVILP